MLVALAVTLVMMAAVVNLFANVSGSIRNRRAVIEVNGQLRQVRQRLALDLAGATCDAKTWQLPGENRGYIEIIEEPWSDMFPSALVNGDTTDGELDYATSLVPAGGDVTTDLTLTTPQLTSRKPVIGDVTNGRALGDWDDVLALTVRSEAEPFKATVGGNMVESTLAEVLWYADENGPGVNNPEIPGMRRIYRRVLLIAPTLGPWDYKPAQNDKGRPDNVSVRLVPGNAPNTGQWVANTLGDLAKRENRAARLPADVFNGNFPFRLTRSELSFEQEHVVLSDALAFDLRVYDPGAPLFNSAGNVVQPGDPGWPAAIVAGPAPGYGAYCDLGWGFDATVSPIYPTGTLPATVPTPVFNQPRPAGFHPTSNPIIGMTAVDPALYDTWSFHYENDGINQDVNSAPNPWQTDTVDQGTNGLDDDGVNGVDDMGERETSPPYPQALRGLKAALRIYERDARQIREVSVTHSFAK